MKTYTLSGRAMLKQYRLPHPSYVDLLIKRDIIEVIFNLKYFFFMSSRIQSLGAHLYGVLSKSVHMRIKVLAIPKTHNRFNESDVRWYNNIS